MLARQLFQRLAALQNGLKHPRLFVNGAQAAVFAFSAVTAFLLRFEFTLPRSHLGHLALAAGVWIAVKSVVFHLYGLDRGWWRFVSLADVVRIAGVNVAASLLSGLLIFACAPDGFPRSTCLVDLLLCFMGTAGMRVAARLVIETVAQVKPAGGERILIYGAGTAGIRLVRDIRSDASLGYQICGFIDDHPGKQGMTIHGVPVLGTGAYLAQLAARHDVQQILITIPSTAGAQMVRVLRRCHEARLRFRAMPAPGKVIEAVGMPGRGRDLAVEDLLGRRTVQLDHDRIRARLEGTVAVITGAAGSIGSELCRQIAGFRPAALVGFDISETALFNLDREMAASFPGLHFYPEIGSVQNPRRLREVLHRYSPSILYHAAAYKHVPLMEMHFFEAIENNVFGTYNVAAAAAEHAVADFVLISSDKAVRPTNIMGATKRLAELSVLSLSDPVTRYAAVRFGNVLGSSGSVIRIFKEQIATGGPVTVTHPDMRRYLMTIREASQLVLQASTMGQGGEIFVLDMGEPVKISDLATNLILLSGLRPGEDIPIEFTGIRPGEKLYEELNMLDENMLATSHHGIRILAGKGLSKDHMAEYLETLRSICASRDVSHLILTLKKIMPDYNPSLYLLCRGLHNSEAWIPNASPEGVAAALRH